ncbi:MAG: hypothetical protein HUU35_18380, partial [Armatimonadetes bacterium]|nr:hypothetical protein [Armatimonadota bacterium]
MARIQWPVLALTLLTAGSLLAQAPPGAEVPRVTIDFDQVEVREAMAQLAEQTGAEFLVTPEVRGTFSARFRDEPLDKVLRLLALTLGAEVRLVEGVF